MPRNITVTFEDGSTHVYQGAPDSVTPDQVAERARRDFGKQVTSLDGGKTAAEPSFVDKAKQQAGNLAAGLVRGAGSIGATLLAPVDVASDLIAGKGLTLEANRERRQAMDNALSMIGADTDSLVYKGGKLAGEIAGTAGAGGAVANTLARVPGVAAAPNLLTAIRTAGMSGGNALTRAVGGAVTGGVSAGMVNPEEAGAGAVVGGVLPGAMQVAGKVANTIGATLRGPAQPADLARAVTAARSSGYVIPPTQANPTLGNRLLEGFSGKITTAQNASAANQGITNAKAATALGLAPDTKLTPDVLTNVRNAAGQAYDAIGAAGTIAPGQAYTKALDDIAAPYIKAAQGFPNAKPSPVLDLVESLKSPSFDASSAVAKIKELRSAADDAFRTGNTDVARASKSAAKALEDAIEDHLSQSGATGLLQQFRDARQLIAKTYSVEKALNPTSGNVDARKLAAQLAKGKPLSGELKDAAEFAARFPKAAQSIEGMGSLPQTSPLDWALGAGMSASTANPLMLASVMARPAARKLALSPVVQNRLIASQASNPLVMALGDPSLAQLGYRAAPVLVADQ